MARITLLEQSLPNAIFTGNNALIQTGFAFGGGSFVLFDPAGSSYFQPIDNLRILEVGFRIPHGYLFGDTEPSVVFLVRCEDTAGSVVTSLLEVGQAGEIFIPNPNIPIDLKGIAVQTEFYHSLRIPAIGHLDTIQLSATFSAGQVSQLNAPNIMNGVDVPVKVYILVKHNFPLVAGPTPA